MRKMFFLLGLVILFSFVFSITCPNIVNDPNCSGAPASSCVGQINDVDGVCEFTQKTGPITIITPPTSCERVTVYCGSPTNPIPSPSVSNYADTIFQTSSTYYSNSSCHLQSLTPYYMSSPICYINTGLIYYVGNAVYQTPQTNTVYTCPTHTPYLVAFCPNTSVTCLGQFWLNSNCNYSGVTPSCASCSGTYDFCNGYSNCCKYSTTACTVCTPTIWFPVVPSNLCTDENIIQKSNCNTVRYAYGMIVRETDSQFCTRLNKCGGAFTLMDNCGDSRTVTCSATCQSGYACVSNSCEQIVDGNCGAANKTYPNTATSFGTDTFCSPGIMTPSTVSFPSLGNNVSWDCNGSGGGTNVSCSAIVTGADCIAPYGERILHGQSRTYFKYSTVDCESDCESEERVCTNGVLSGSFTENSCSNHCNDAGFSEGAFGLQTGDKNLFACNTESCWLLEKFNQGVNSYSLTSSKKNVFFVDGFYNPGMLNSGFLHTCNSTDCNKLFDSSPVGNETLHPFRGTSTKEGVYVTSQSSRDIYLFFNDGAYTEIQDTGVADLSATSAVSFGNYYVYINCQSDCNLMKSYYDGSTFSQPTKLINVNDTYEFFHIVSENESVSPLLAVLQPINTCSAPGAWSKLYSINSAGVTIQLLYPEYESFSQSGYPLGIILQF